MSGRPDPHPLAANVQTLMWGLFCACSWTWCIGMYLPRIMIERHGWPGFIVFAAPNVLGCAGFGYIVKTRVASQAMVIRHGGMMAWFSTVTVAYHMFFIAWLLDDVVPLFGDAFWLPLAAAAIVWGLGLVMSYLPDRDWLWLSAATYLISLSAVFIVGFHALSRIGWTGRDPLSQLGWITPVLFFGFLLCPYLDLTFHRAVQRSPSRHAFAVFGFAFFVMILLTCLIWFGPSSLIVPMAMVHILAQATFTVGAHLRELRESRAIRDERLRRIMMAAPIAGALVMPISRLFTENPGLGQGMYLRFLVFYGLVFPTLVLLYIAAWRARAALGTGRILVISLIIASLPLYELGFLDHQPWLTVIPLLVLGFWVAVVPRFTGGKAER